ncbi:hypothetical protein BV22DRAFT_1050184 [Leucogyrophana mollusca]|uniref:Uncharacterized protein n=1 Tax=Leucogyrophana mollusca TaxID=85980 RepID=A0ACB8B4L2_9AGAM|nr:hypothetical protein BV22DRAFT_1050184 [Leucogyrophana mollusca]
MPDPSRLSSAIRTPPRRAPRGVHLLPSGSVLSSSDTLLASPRSSRYNVDEAANDDEESVSDSSAVTDESSADFRHDCDVAKLVLEAARAKRKVCRAEQYLAECVLEEHTILGDLYRCKAEAAERKLENADLNVGRVRTFRSSFARLKHSWLSRLVPAPKGRWSVDRVGRLMESFLSGNDFLERKLSISRQMNNRGVIWGNQFRSLIGITGPVGCPRGDNLSPKEREDADVESKGEPRRRVMPRPQTQPPGKAFVEDIVPRRSSRSNRGKGGAAKQLEKIGDALNDNGRARVKDKARAAPNIPDDEPVNPMAPGVLKKKSKKSKDVGAPVSKSKVVEMPPVVEESKAVIERSKAVVDKSNAKTSGRKESSPSCDERGSTLKLISPSAAPRTAKTLTLKDLIGTKPSLYMAGPSSRFGLRMTGSNSAHRSNDPKYIYDEPLWGSQPRNKFDSNHSRTQPAAQATDEPMWGSQPRDNATSKSRASQSSKGHNSSSVKNPHPQRASKPAKDEPMQPIDKSSSDESSDEATGEGSSGDEATGDESSGGEARGDVSSVDDSQSVCDDAIGLSELSGREEMAMEEGSVMAEEDPGNYEQEMDPGLQDFGNVDDAEMEDSIDEQTHQNGNYYVVDVPSKGIRNSDSDAHGYDVLERHYSKNRSPRAPSPGYLDDIRRSKPHSKPSLKYRRARKTPKGNQKSPRPVSPSQSTGSTACSDDVRPRKRGKYSKNRKSAIDPSPTKLGFYPPLWKDFLEQCKYEIRLHAVTVEPFPQMHEALEGIALETLSMVLVAYKEKKKLLEPDVYPTYKAGMVRLIYDDLGTFRSELKKFIGGVVKNAYPLSPPQLLPSREAHVAFVKKAAKRWLKKGAYLRGEPDEQGRSTNFAANAIREGCTFFYRNGRHSLKRAPELASSVPHYGLVLVCLAVKCTLRGYAEHGYDKIPDFSVDIYSPEAKNMKTLLDSVLADEYHGPKLEKQLRDWAAYGLYGNSAPDEDFDDDSDGDAIVLD